MALYISDTLTPSFGDKKMVMTDTIFDESKNKFQSEINTKLMEGKRYDSENDEWVDNKAQVENSLTSDSTEVALSAAQGKKLNDSLTALQEEITTELDNIKEEEINGSRITKGTITYEKLDATIQQKFTNLEAADIELAGSIEALSTTVNNNKSEVNTALEGLTEGMAEETPTIMDAINKAKVDITTAYTKAIEDAIGVVLNTPV